MLHVQTIQLLLIVGIRIYFPVMSADRPRKHDESQHIQPS